jgi:hypothetical protein
MMEEQGGQPLSGWVSGTDVLPTINERIKKRRRSSIREFIETLAEIERRYSKGEGPIDISQKNFISAESMLK